MSLIGKFFCHMGAEYMHTGKVVAQVDPASVLIEIDRCEHVPKTLTIVALDEMTSTMSRDGSIDTNWEFFASKADLEAWLTWLETPSEDESSEPASQSMN
jgi:hypothetical protein